MATVNNPIEDSFACNLWPIDKENSVIVSCIQQAIAILCLNKSWITLPLDAASCRINGMAGQNAQHS